MLAETEKLIGYEIMNDTYVIDGTNVCWWYNQAHPKEASILSLLTVLIALLENDDDFYCVFDAPITHLMDEQGKKADAAAIENLLKDHPERFFRVTGSTSADAVILHDANHHGRNIITNDIYRDYRDKHSWLSDKYTARLVQGNLQPSGLMTLEKLKYGQLSLQTDTELALHRLHELLAVRQDPAVTELDRQIQQRQQSLENMKRECVAQESRVQELASQVEAFEKKEEEMRNLSAERDTLRSEILDFTAQRNEVRASLEALHDIRDFDVIEKEMKETLGKLTTDITSLNARCGKKADELATLETQASQYQSILDKKREAEEAERRKLQDDQACIKKAQAAIAAFLEPYPDSYGRPTLIPFEGSSWDTAEKALKIFFDRNRICTHCYECNGTWKDECVACQKGTMTDNPEEIWKIIKSCAPRRGVLGVIKRILS